jgi:hypothetical protein
MLPLRFASRIAKQSTEENHKSGGGMPFQAIVKRTVVLVNSETGEKERFTLAIGAPYRPAKTEGMADHAGCMLQAFEEIDDPGMEIVGADEFEALENAISNAKLILDGLLANGTVETVDGKPFTIKSESKYTRAWQYFSERARKKFGNK